MTKNFDVDRKVRSDKDRTFVINGQTFTHKPAVAPEALTEWSAMVGGEFVERNADGSIVLDGDHNPVTSLTEQEALRIYEATILAFLEEGQEDAWREARRVDAPNPINLRDLTEVITWLFEETSGRPTGPSSSSSESSPGGGNGQPATTSTAPLLAPVVGVPASTA